ncbi:MAG: hypothetical protein C5B56_12900 [Proteobacteria bacterium]|nr:MAG: hypothetical protein C5B56_12900 [Pseudomonadota bacterium]
MPAIHHSTTTVSSGQTAVDLTVGAGDTLIVLSGGTTSDTSVSGTEIVSSGGHDVGATINSGGQQQVYGIATSVTVSAGGTQTVSKGGVASHTTVSSGGTMSETAGGSALYTTIAAGGTETVLAQGSDTGAVVAGVQIVRGDAIGAEVVAGGTQSVVNGGTASNTLVEAGGTQNVAMGGTASNALVEMGGTQTVSKGGVATNTSIGSGGTESVGTGGVANNTLVETGGTQIISKGGAASSTIVGSGGTQSVLSGGVASNTLVEAGGTENVSDGGVTFGSVLSGASDQNPPSAGGLHIVFSYPHGGVPAAAQAALQIAAQFLENMFVFATPLTVNISVDWGDINGFPIPPQGLAASQDAHIGVNVSFATLVNALHLSGAQLPASDPTSGGGFYVASAEAKALGLLPGNNAATDGYIGFGNTVTWDYAQQGVVGAIDFIAAAEHEITEAMGRTFIGRRAVPPFLPTPFDLFRYTAPGVLAFDNFSQQAYLSLDGGVTNLGKLQNSGGGDPADFADAINDPFGIGTPGQANPATLTDIEEMDALFGGVPLNLAKENLSGGTAWNTVVSAGGLLTVGSGGVALGTTILSGGFEAVSAGGHSLGATVSNGGQLDVYSGGNDINATLPGTGTETVYAGGVATGTTVPVGQLFAYGTTVSAILTLSGIEWVFSGGVASATLVSGGTLAVSAGGVASNTLVESDGASFGMVDRGTEIGTTVLTGGVDFVFSGGIASGTVVSSGGEQEVTFGGTANGTVVSNGGVQIAEFGGVANGTVVGSGGTASAIQFGETVNTVISSGGTESVALGGNAVATVVSNGGSQVISNGGQAIRSLIQQGGTQTVISGGVASGTIVSSGGTESVTVLGVADGTTVLNGGQQVVAGLSSSAVGPNLIRNGGFETGRVPPLWTRSDALSIRAEFSGNFGLPAHSGDFYAGLFTFGHIGTLSQTIADVPGVQYTLSYWLAGDGQTPNYFEADWNGAAQADSVTNNGLFQSGYYHYVFTVTGTGFDTLTFREVDDGGVLALDDVSLVSGTQGGIASGTVISSGGVQTVIDGGTPAIPSLPAAARNPSRRKASPAARWSRAARRSSRRAARP